MSYQAFSPSVLLKQWTSAILPETFYDRPTVEVARDLIGKVFVRRIGKELLAGRLIEVEAYHQDGDEAAHSYKGRTPRTEVMFGPPGRLYVYFTYGMHFCMNVVTEEEGTGAAVLIRGIEPITGIEAMRRNRGDSISDGALTNGPAKCCQAFNIARSDNAAVLCRPGSIFIADSGKAPGAIRIDKRIGITRSVDLPWRFYEDGNPCVSRR